MKLKNQRPGLKGAVEPVKIKSHNLGDRKVIWDLTACQIITTDLDGHAVFIAIARKPQISPSTGHILLLHYTDVNQQATTLETEVNGGGNL
jgi:hypothetical protein